MTPQAMIILDGSGVFSRLFDRIRIAACRHYVTDDELESLYDWIITEAIAKEYFATIQRHVSIRLHQTHDVYQCIYDEVGTFAQQEIRWLMTSAKIHFQPDCRLKVLVTYRDIIIVRTQSRRSGM